MSNQFQKGEKSPLTTPRPKIERELMRLGLSPKEAQVYLAALELGAGSAQEIAKQSDVHRATTYVIIEELTERGLMSSVERRGKRLFMAEPPERLRQMVRQEEERLREAQGVIRRVLPELAVLAQSAPERPRVRFYEGLEGLEAMRLDFFKSDQRFELLAISAADDYHRVVGLARRLPHAKRIERTRGFERCIFTSSRTLAELKKALPSVERVTRFRIPEKEFPLAGEIAVYGPKIALLSYQGEVMGVLIESSFLAQTAASLFNLAWETAKRFEKVE
ncbi:hypothetical protein HY628_01565 [Candidatus Uhrbacteria bacterium]|nr:hypothetical protein [Candidatus Uhrbacteria bacterium]